MDYPEVHQQISVNLSSVGVSSMVTEMFEFLTKNQNQPIDPEKLAQAVMRAKIKGELISKFILRFVEQSPEIVVKIGVEKVSRDLLKMIDHVIENHKCDNPNCLIDEAKRELMDFNESQKEEIEELALGYQIMYNSESVKAQAKEIINQNKDQNEN